MTTVMFQATGQSTGITAPVPGGYEALSDSKYLSIVPTVTWWMQAAFEQRHGRYGLLIYNPRTGAVQMFLTTEAELDGLCAAIEWCLQICSYWPACEPLLEEWRELWQLAKDVYDQVRLRKTVLAWS